MRGPFAEVSPVLTIPGMRVSNKPSKRATHSDGTQSDRDLIVMGTRICDRRRFIVVIAAAGR